MLVKSIFKLNIVEITINYFQFKLNLILEFTNENKFFKKSTQQ